MKTRIILFTLLMTCLASCARAAIDPTTIVPTATLTPILTDTPVPSTPTPLPVPEATPIPTQTPPRFLLTPDAIQVERWKEYQSALIKVVMAGYIANAGSPASASIYDYASCEWDILGRAKQKVYVWAYCGFAGGESADLPVVITLDVNGSIQKMEAPSRYLMEEAWNAEARKMFPADVREKFDKYLGSSMFNGRIHEMIDHIRYREKSGEPPLVVLSASPAP